MTPQQRAVYERDRIIDMSQKSQIYTAELKGRIQGEAIGLEKGEVIGLEKGEVIGLEKGEVIGLEKGKAIGSQNEKEEAVIRGHNKGHSIDTIAEFTNLTPDQIIEILKKYGLMK